MMKAKLKQIDWRDLAIRAVKTFIQTFVSYLTIDGLFAISDRVEMQRWALTTGVSALAAGISAVWNLVLDIVSDKAGEALDKIGEEKEKPSGAGGEEDHDKDDLDGIE